MNEYLEVGHLVVFAWNGTADIQVFPIISRSILLEDVISSR